MDWFFFIFHIDFQFAAISINFLFGFSSDGQEGFEISKN